MSLTAIDLFAGLGGFTQAAAGAGVRVVWAANHSPEAVKYHAANHPGVDHVTQDLHLCDWGRVPDHDILLASPCCQGFSRAKGRRPDNEANSRSTAWCVFSCMARRRPLAAVVENVEEFRLWSESDAKHHRGITFRMWRKLIETIGPGYDYAELVIDAADCGVPQNRKRLFMVFTRADAIDGPVLLKPPTRPHTPIITILRDDEKSWTRIATKAESTRNCVERSGTLFRGRRFLLPYYGETLRRGVGRSVDRPIGTITTKARYALVDETHRWMRMLGLDEVRAAMGFPEAYRLPSSAKQGIALLGNAVVPAAGAWVLKQVVEALGARRVAA